MVTIVNYFSVNGQTYVGMSDGSIYVDNVGTWMLVRKPSLPK